MAGSVKRGRILVAMVALLLLIPTGGRADSVPPTCGTAFGGDARRCVQATLEDLAITCYLTYDSRPRCSATARVGLVAYSPTYSGGFASLSAMGLGGPRTFLGLTANRTATKHASGEWKGYGPLRVTRYISLPPATGAPKGCLTYRAEIRVWALAMADPFGGGPDDFGWVSSSHKHSMTKAYGYCKPGG